MIVERATKSKVAGGIKLTWATLGTYNLHWRQLSAKEIEQNLKLGLKTTDRFYYLAGALSVTEEDRIVWNSETYDITSVQNPHYLGNHTEITCNKNG